MGITQDLAVSLGLAVSPVTGVPLDSSRRLPSVGDLARRHNVSQAKIRKELKQLAAQGLVEYRGRGQGWWSVGYETVREMADHLTKAIAGGRWRPGKPLPPADRLAAELGASARTVHLAELLLLEQGLLKRSGAATSPIVALSALEFGLVRGLRRTRGRFVPHEALIRQLWPDGGNRDRLKVLVGHVRRKLGTAVRITTARGRGYTMEREARQGPGLVEVDGLVLDPATGLARDGDDELSLSRDQFAVLLQLAKYAEVMVPRPKLVEVIRDRPANDHTLNGIVRELRLKLGKERIATYRSRGYRLVAGDSRFPANRLEPGGTT